MQQTPKGIIHNLCGLLFQSLVVPVASISYNPLQDKGFGDMLTGLLQAKNLTILGYAHALHIHSNVLSHIETIV